MGGIPYPIAPFAERSSCGVSSFGYGSPGPVDEETSATSVTNARRRGVRSEYLNSLQECRNIFLAEVS
jgi:hypothetical protein